jgi:hypothetical protein
MATKYSVTMALDELGSYNNIHNSDKDVFSSEKTGSDKTGNRQGNTDWNSVDSDLSFFSGGSDVNTETGGSDKFYENIPELKNEDITNVTLDGDLDNIPAKNLIKYTSLQFGRSPVVNPPWQFGELDDVRSNPTYPYMGRVYLEQIYSNFPIMTVEPGRERYCKDPFLFFGLSFDANKYDSYIKNDGNGFSIPGLTTVANIIGSIFSIVWDSITGADPDKEKFLRFHPAMKLFKSYINDIMRETASNLGLLFWGDSLVKNIDEQKNAYTQGAQKVMEYNAKLSGDNPSDSEKTKWYEEVANIFKGVFGWGNSGNENNPADQDINGNMIGSHKNMLGGSEYNIDGDTMLVIDSDPDGPNSYTPYRGTLPTLSILNFLPDASRGGSSNVSPKGLADLEDTVRKAANQTYIPFLIQKTTISETFGNSTTPHPLGTQLNSMAEEKQNQKAFGMGGAIARAIGEGGSLDQQLMGLLDQAKNAIVGEVAQNVAEMGMLVAGNGRAIFPEMWSQSSYNRSYSIEIPLWVPVGDTISIFECVYVPYLIWFCLTNPLQNSRNMYTSPFVVRLTSKGLFTIPFGIVETLQVTRGEEKNDRTIDGLCRTIKLSIGIKDLQPSMMLSLGGGTWWKLKKNNSGLTEYLATLTNMTIADRYNMMNTLKKFVGQTIASAQDAFSLNNIKFNLSQSFIFKPLMWWYKGTGNISVDDTPKFGTI